MQKFIAETRYINSKNLNEFESSLAARVNLKRAGRNASNFANRDGDNKRGSRYADLLNQAKSQEAGSRQMIRGNSKEETFQLPNIHNVHSGSVADLHPSQHQARGGLNIVKSARHSQVVSSYKDGHPADNEVY